MRTDDGFLASLNDVAPLEDGALRIATFNPGSNVDQMSLLRLVNPGGEEAEGDGDRHGRRGRCRRVPRWS